MTPIERAARAAKIACPDYEVDRILNDKDWVEIVSAALLALATPEAISDEMVLAGCHALYPGNWAEKRKKEMREVIAASIRAGAGEKG